MTSYNLLMIEDDPAVAQGLQDGLIRDGFTVTWKSTGADGVACARKTIPHLVLLDVRLPDGSGFDFCRALRQSGLRMPVIMLTAQQDALDKVLGLENALKFTPKGGAIELQIQQKDDQDHLIVTDTGLVILPEDLPQFFSRFHRGRNSAEFPGNGLGLAIIKAIAAAHGGQVSVENAGKEQGSRFTLVLPVG